jgi:hypothetical protein
MPLSRSETTSTRRRSCQNLSNVLSMSETAQIANRGPDLLCSWKPRACKGCRLGADWSYNAYGVDSVSDTYYEIDFWNAKVLVINNAYSTENNIGDSGLAPGCLDWLEGRLANTDKPVVIISHIPISFGTGGRVRLARFRRTKTPAAHCSV